mmetsp:Transcript_5507/g.9096  ORF Transcript_5507/g.9096 Transcript_5507/m.9096 type:complete len:238 (+) Transcript_5507:711-1424(+)
MYLVLVREGTWTGRRSGNVLFDNDLGGWTGKSLDVGMDLNHGHGRERTSQLRSSKSRWQDVDSSVGMLVTNSTDDEGSGIDSAWWKAVSHPAGWTGATEKLGGVVARACGESVRGSLVLEVVEPVVKALNGGRVALDDLVTGMDVGGETFIHRAVLWRTVWCAEWLWVTLGTSTSNNRGAILWHVVVVTTLGDYDGQGSSDGTQERSGSTDDSIRSSEGQEVCAGLGGEIWTPVENN